MTPPRFAVLCRAVVCWAALSLAWVVAVGACVGNQRYTKNDSIAFQEALECVRPPDISPPPGSYEDRNIELEWDRLVNPDDPMSYDVDMSYVFEVGGDPDSLEQVYYDATHGHVRASFMACQYEVAARLMGRNIARYLTSFKCTSILNCRFKEENLSFSDQTASGLRILTFIAKEFQREAKLQGAWDELIGYAMPRVAGGKVSKRVRPKGPLIIPGRRGPGRWVRVNESMSKRARAYQERITQHTSKEAYEVNGVKFDGYRKGVLIEAKGPGYARFIKNGQFRQFFTGQHSLLDQAKRQRRAVKKTPIEWHIAEREMADLLRKTFANEGIFGIRVVHTP